MPSELPAVELVPGTPEDEWLTVALETDPDVMAELGGPWTADEARGTHHRRMAYIREHDPKKVASPRGGR